MKYLIRVLPYLRPYRRLAVYSVLVTILTAASSILAPWPLKVLVDDVLGGRRGQGAGHHYPIGLLVFAIVAGLLITLLSSGLNVVGKYLTTTIEQRIILDFRCDLFRHAESLGVTYHDGRSHSLLMYGINFEADAAGGLIMALQPLAQSALTLLGMFWVAMHIDTELALLSLIVLPFLYYSAGYYASNIQDRLQKVKLIEAGSLSVIHEALGMIRVIVAFGRQAYEHRRFRAQGERAVTGRVGVTVRQTMFSLAVSMTTATGTALVLGVGAYHALAGKLTVGQLLIVMSYIGAVYKPLEAISYTFGTLQDRFIALGMAFSVLDTKPQVQDVPGAITLTGARGHVGFEGVHFSYAGRVGTLKDISFEAQPGQVVAIVGPTGAGKTTLMGLIPRFYDPQEGRVLLDGHDLRTLSRASLCEQISIVPQEPMLFSGTVADNIRYGRLEATMDEIIEAATGANAHEFIMHLPNQYDTEVGSRGAQLSGGERQRICIARAFLKDAPILILDEPTSAIDSRTEAVILDALDRLMVGRTTFMIAHRLSTIRHADLILVLNQGQLVEAGSHEVLMGTHGLYRQLHDVQMSQSRRRLRLTALGAGAEADVVSPEEERVESMEPPDALVVEETSELAAAYASNPPTHWNPGETVAYAVTVTNCGSQAWNAAGPYEVKLGIHFGAESDAVEECWATDQRFVLTGDVPPGASDTVTVQVTAPEAVGDFVLRHRMVKEQLAWFEQMQRSVAVVAPSMQLSAAPAPPTRRLSLPTGSFGRTVTPPTGREAWSTGVSLLRRIRLPNDEHADPAAADAIPCEGLVPQPAPALPPATPGPATAAPGEPGATPTVRKTIVVLGMMSRYPVPGVIWQTVHYLVGLARLGHTVYYVEAHADAPVTFIERADEDGSVRAASFIAGVMERFDLGDRWAFQALHADGRCYGMSERRLHALYRSADAVINLHGGTHPRPEHCATGRLVYLETDPVAPQIRLHHREQRTIEFLAAHQAHFTFAENYGNPDCRLPVSDHVAYRPTRQPVVLDFWQSHGREGRAFTTVASWRQSGRDVIFQGDVYYWSKHQEFMKVIDLPKRTGAQFELALNRHEDDEPLLRSMGWRVRDALGFGTDTDGYRQFIAHSRGEFTVAKDQNIRLRTGWFSDRSATYLAAGRPVITQETGFGRILPTGDGLFAFSTLEEAAEAVARIDADYQHHSRAAGEIARAYFSHDVVLPRLLDAIGV